MSSLARADTLPVTKGEALRRTFEAEAYMLSQPQVDIETLQVLHAGIYSRTVLIPAGVALTGALIKIPTVLTIVGDMFLTAGDKTIEVDRFACFKCPAGRKQIMVAKTDCYVTMAFASDSKNEREAEEEFTDEVDKLMSRKKE